MDIGLPVLGAPLISGQTQSIGSPNHLTQIQHKGDRVEIVDHLFKNTDDEGFHIIHKVGPNGEINEEEYNY